MDAQKTPIARTLEAFAERKVRNVMALLDAKALPASVAKVVSSGIVVVRFELTNIPYTLPNLTVPMLGAEYTRLPIQPGCLGWVQPANAFMGAMSGLGGGTADLTPPAPLSALVWSPVGNVNWSATDNPNAYVIYGPDGVVARTSDGTSKVVISRTGIDVYPPAGVRCRVHGDLEVDGDLLLTGGIKAPGGGVYPGALYTSGPVVAGYGTGDQVGLQTHNHPYVKPASGSTVPANTNKPNANT